MRRYYEPEKRLRVQHYSRGAAGAGFHTVLAFLPVLYFVNACCTKSGR
jgi:hypothetical protein